jgi:hypothetical protein
MNYKGVLLEHCQQNKRDLPEFKFVEHTINGIKNYSCNIMFNSMIYKGDIFPNKKMAQQDTSKKLLENLGHLDLMDYTTYTPGMPEDIHTVYMVDGENMPKLVDHMIYSPSVQIYIYFSKHHPLVDKTVKSFVIKSVSPCTRNDGCDIYMTMDIMNMPSRYPNLKYIYICTGDKFASAVVDNFSEFFPNIRVGHEGNIKSLGY